MVAGVLLVAGCALAVGQVVARAGDRRPVLAVTRAVGVGHVLAASDVQAVQVAAGPQVQTMPVSARDQVVGRAVAVPVPAGSLLSPRDLGPARFPAAGQALVGVAVKPGAFPPGLSTGARVHLVTGSSNEDSGTAGDAGGRVTVTGHASRSSGTPGGVVTATVVSVRSPDAMNGAAGSPGGAAGGVTVLGVQVPARQAAAVARAGSLRVVAVAAGE